MAHLGFGDEGLGLRRLREFRGCRLRAYGGSR